VKSDDVKRMYEERIPGVFGVCIGIVAGIALAHFLIRTMGTH